MANRNFPCNKQYNFHVMPVLVDMQISIGAAGAPTLSSAPGVKAIRRLKAGVYEIQLKDNYNALLGMDANIISQVSGAAIDPAVATIGDLVRITTVGDSDFATAGLPSSITPAVGATFVIAALPAAGTGRVKLVVPSGTMSIELAGQMMNSNAPSQGASMSGTNGAFVIIEAIQPQIGALTAQGSPLQFASADPADGSVLEVKLYLNNSSVQ